MPSVEIITIGTEILLGEIVDTNARFLARNLRDISIDLYRKTTVGDNAKRIAQAIQQAMERSDVIITTGGLGPTVDDPTRDAVALALGVETEFHPELWEQIQARFQRFGRPPTENNKRQAYIPKGAIAIENPVGTAPSFIMEYHNNVIISLPGVPREMEYLLKNSVVPYLCQKYQLTGIIKARVLHTAGAGESQIDELIGSLETLNNPTVGLAAHSGQVDVRITAKAESEEKADNLIQGVENQIRTLLGEWIYGVDQETLEEVALRAVQRHGWSLAVIESGLNGDLTSRLASTVQKQPENTFDNFRGGEVMTQRPSPEELLKLTDQYRHSRQVDVCIGVVVHPGLEKQEVYLAIVTPDGQQQLKRPYGGPPEYAPRWALNHSLDVLRKL